MRRSRVLLFALLVALLGLVSRTHANAFPCIPCICAQNCENALLSCDKACNGNQTCLAGCGTRYSSCVEGCH
jgi:hypothetical protein